MTWLLITFNDESNEFVEHVALAVDLWLRLFRSDHLESLTSGFEAIGKLYAFGSE
jgi:hypothetical protein